ncbi:bifunctional UDP-N-acetylglucosamine diphosphorylase/glucosamine-1-phosphate N-acetyltransferase GlmU [Geoalkalibacter halelectricus]|uniref:Bifunctional protein GlmU n=1 Tax=Geoalkalibacter halelectricus TaxID=2847045 RepID=A0ABY5ZSK9_9BACT|nr:bifunctional UDP-N-acetylglucosamine diphosphorylase/glucosamine-1-phosphate N-acetyltransferase GlmU [Geoalkalibacter halelectricus]MDO3377721.1 bifunctional UDP-N-acetylglucosamine diphosphorylase/glucosamine-1-phosphate N-acetyltransferase GlmU [Geoalkalibacter halelectricus]UWZ81509.1 bifunctional UDP-N-acetylglucosamine diphosphorylase/glucosamine-1-phosphate N-acetyltransferase GlmU [Geoalkalibacter halelectricus]
MSEQKRAAVILAAGKGTRMKSERAKVLHPLAGQPLAAYPARLARALGCDPSVLVVGHQAAEVEQALGGEGLHFALQQEQLGTGHALLCAADALRGFSGDLLLLCGDVPLIRRETLERLLAYHAAEGAAVTVLTAEMVDPKGYGRIVRDGAEVLRIVEEKDASQKEKLIREINTGLYVFEAPFVFEALRGVGRDNAQNEYYLTDVVAAARVAGKKVRALSVADPAEAMGINDRVQLAEAGRILRTRINQAHMLAGVSLVDPACTYIDAGVEIGAETLIHPNVHLRGATRVGPGCEIEPGAVISDSVLGAGVHVKAGTVMSEARIGDACALGPMAHLRPGTVLKGRNKLGNFVETKKATFDEKAQASHLTYIGDAEVGKNVNIGCGTITCNYDGVNKYQTIIEDDVFVGSDTQFVAPVRIGRGSLIGAGSTITKDVPAGALALSRAEQKTIEGWAERKRAKQKKS